MFQSYGLMNYIEVSLKGFNNNQSRENLIALLLDSGYDSFMETESTLHAYITSNKYDQENLNKILNAFDKGVEVEKVEELTEQNWNSIWESNYEPVPIGSNCIVRAPFHQKPAEIEFDIVIQPKMSFGTAHHATTSLMAQLILEEEFAGKSVLDIGTGTGILAILASLKGAQKVIAIDNDEWAYSNALENCELNNIENIEIKYGDASAIPNKHYDILMANINRNILLGDMHHYAKHLKQDARIYLSGFYQSDLEAIRNEAGKFGWVFAGQKVKDNWVAVVFQKKGSD